MSIIPVISRPSGPANRTQETVFWDSLHVSSSETIYGVGDFIRLYYSNHYGVSDVTIDGTLWAASTGGVSGALAGMYMNHITVTGTVAAEARVANSSHGQANAYAISNGSHGQSVTNSGTIYAYTDVGLAQAITHYGPGVTVTNSGLIAARTEAYGDTRISGASTILMYNGGSLHNEAGGQILAEGATARAVLMGQGKSSGDPDPSIVNDGTIRAVALGDGQQSVGIHVSNFGHQTMRIVNNGLIEADLAITTGSPNWPATPSGQTIENNAGGIIRGNIVGELGTETIINAGRITGNILLGEGDDLVDSSAGEHFGFADLGWGNDIYIGGKSAERIDGGRMGDELDGGAGHDLLLGGFGDDLLIGGAGNDGLYGDYGNDSFVLSKADAAYGGQGTDHFKLTDLRFALIDGGADTDTIELPAISGTLDLGSIMASSRVTGIEIIDLGAAGTAALSATDMGAALHNLRVEGVGTLTLAGSWTSPGTIEIDGESYRIYRANGSKLLVLDTVTVTQQAAMPADTIGIDPVAGGNSAPTIEDDPDLVFTSPVWNNVHFTVTDDLVIESYEIWRGNPIYSAMSAHARDATVTNFGTIRAGQKDGHAVAAVRVDVLKLFANHGTISAKTEFDYVMAFTAEQSVDLLNTGSIVAATDEGFATAVNLSPSHTETTPALENSGLISAVATIGEAEAVVFRDHNNRIINSGTIEAVGSIKATALHLSGQNDITNSGRIEARVTDPANAGSATAIYLHNSYQDFTFVNSGSIIGTVAITTSESSSSYYGGALELINEAGGVIMGDILLAEAPDRITNEGTIRGDVRLGQGRDFFDSRMGIFDGTIDAGGGHDRILMGAGAQTIDGGGGNDELFGGSGDDLLIGGRGNDALDGGDGTDTARFAGKRSAYTITETSTGIFEVAGPDGTDVLENVEYAHFADTTVELTLWTPPPGSIVGTSADDGLKGTQQSDEIYGLGGDDEIDGRGGDDMLVGGTGADRIQGGLGADVLEGEQGDDTLIGQSGSDVLAGGAGNDIYLIDEFDTVTELAGEGIDEVRMSGFDYTLGDDFEILRIRAGSVDGTGNALDNKLFGSTTSNTLRGLGGDDLIDGKGGRDILQGNSGDDILIGGGGQDTLRGGTGADRFVWRNIGDGNASANSADIIADFSQAQGDVIALANIDADITGGTSNDAFTFIGKSAFSGTAGELRFKFSDGDTIVQLDVDGDARVDMSIRLTGEIDLAEADFLGIAPAALPQATAYGYGDLATAAEFLL